MTLDEEGVQGWDVVFCVFLLGHIGQSLVEGDDSVLVTLGDGFTGDPAEHPLLDPIHGVILSLRAQSSVKDTTWRGTVKGFRCLP